MSNKVSTAFSALGQPFQSPLHLDFLQNASKLDIANLIIGMIGASYSTSIVYRLYGAVLTDLGGDTYSNTIGAVFLNGEVYAVDAVTWAISMPDGIDMETYDNTTGSTVFVDGSTHSINVSKRMRYLNNAIPVYGSPTECRFNTIIGGNAGMFDGQTLTFKCNQTIVYATASTTNVYVTLDFTGAATGSEVVVYAPLNTITSLLFTGGTPLLINAPTSITSGMTQAWFRFKYMGAISGTHYFTQEEFAV